MSPDYFDLNSQQHRLQLTIQGTVQGVGFRPFIYRLATELNLTGWINNSVSGVLIEVEGLWEVLEQFKYRILQEKPPQSEIQTLDIVWLPPVGYSEFEIRVSESTNHPQKIAIILPDLSTCSDCLQDIFDPENRRYQYPFTNCTNCGPRYSIIRDLPYDRNHTTMATFTMCSDCQNEYNHPLNRRFHAQPNACPVCGPQLELWDKNGKVIASLNQALKQAADIIRSGQILALKGLGGFHLIVDARNETAIENLRQRKRRPAKPLAVMYPNLEQVKQDCLVSELEEKLLSSPAAPIVLLRRIFNQLKSDPPHPPLLRGGEENQTFPPITKGGLGGVTSPEENQTFPPLGKGGLGGVTSPEENQTFPPITKGGLGGVISPKNPYLGVMLPYTPIHHLLLAQLNFPIVATSGNFANEPICIDEAEVVTRLNTIADFFLVHNRPIVRPIDDSIVRIIANQEMVLRRARGYAPLPFSLPDPIGANISPLYQTNLSLAQSWDLSIENPIKILALGGHLKSTIAIAFNQKAFVSQHIGDLENPPALAVFQEVIDSLSNIYDFQPNIIVCDAHPDYYSTQFAEKLSQQNQYPIVRVQHHLAHVFAVIAEHNLQPPLLGIAWDGTGYGLDGTIWGGEFFQVTETIIQRIASFRRFPLPGGDKAVSEPRRIALGLLYELLGNDLFNSGMNLEFMESFKPQELRIMQTMLNRNLNTPLTSSVGRLFDGVAGLLGICQRVSFEGEAAMALEFAINDLETDEYYPFAWLDTPQPPLKIGKNRRDFDTPQPPLEMGENMDNMSYNCRYYLNWELIIKGILEDKINKKPINLISAKFHNSLVEAVVEISQKLGEKTITLSGGCFQNKYLIERTISRLCQEGFQVYWSQKNPPNDGGLALGQAAFLINHQRFAPNQGKREESS
ncbi:carbamoyltransferase HypF [Planktothrix agardhii]|uniref:carbamoyltransferase HypF n=2 Tax=Planktothrix agardhii TaxID=1160 RepID=UPI0020A7C23C|nr:carbamoyltransferase HypF [Planktothrix agardhii]CAD5924662.1 Carbamoyltransferase HypF [Planktothrix agardhii]